MLTDLFSACITSILRLYYTYRLLSSTDTSWNEIIVGLWGMVEIAIGFLYVCLTSVPKFLQIITPKLSQFSRTYGLSKTTTTAALSANFPHGTKDTGKWKKASNNYTELEDWERGPGFQERQVTITDQGPKVSQESLEDGHIFQTMSVEIEEYSGLKAN